MWPSLFTVVGLVATSNHVCSDWRASDAQSDNQCWTPGESSSGSVLLQRSVLPSVATAPHSEFAAFEHTGRQAAGQIVKVKLDEKTHPLLHSQLQINIRVGTDWRAGAGEVAPLTEKGYKQVAQLHSLRETEAFIRRVIAKEDLKIIDEGGLKGIVPYYSGHKSKQSLRDLTSELEYSSHKKNDGWLRKCDDDSESEKKGRNGHTEDTEKEDEDFAKVDEEEESVAQESGRHRHRHRSRLTDKDWDMAKQIIQQSEQGDDRQLVQRNGKKTKRVPLSEEDNYEEVDNDEEIERFRKRSKKRNLLNKFRKRRRRRHLSSSWWESAWTCVTTFLDRAWICSIPSHHRRS